MQIFLQSRGTDWSALFCASKPACSCIYRDGRCLMDSGMIQPVTPLKNINFFNGVFNKNIIYDNLHRDRDEEE